ncbi:putative F-box protein At3g10240 [Solanum tuberosum]|uniref:putative F-box protein At3g10240 n=1 Tax=Solanum tuberosum TaxID=4113 RepID=UPI00073A292B|nr:PREDICTED: putative F-box protein At3g10240 [Solanum tuberosum]
MGSEVIAICNPATREVRFLPDVPHEGEDFICSIGFEREENKYKVVLTIETNGKLSRAWVFTLGIDKSWREMIKYGEHDYYIAGHISGICISGIIYRISLAPDYCIVAFDVKSEIFTSITMSIELCRSFIDCDNMLIEVNGKLGMMKYSDYLFGNDIYLWVFEEHEEWKHEILHIPLEREPNEFYFDPFMIRKYGAEEIVFAIHITSRSHDDVLVFYIYDMKNKSWRHFEVQEFPGQIESICTYSETLFSLENIGSVHHQV